MQVQRFASAMAAALIAAALASCNVGKAPEPTLDVNAVYTSAAQTLSAGFSAQQTQTAAAVTPTLPASPTPLATLAVGTGSVPFGTPFTLSTPFTLATPGVRLTPLPAGTLTNGFAVGCNNASYLAETKPNDGATVTGGDVFKKGWSLQNTGTCVWNAGYSFAFNSGDRLDGKDITITDKADFTDPGHSQTFIVPMTAPTAAGEYKGFWQMKAPDGTWFGSRVWFDVVVK